MAGNTPDDTGSGLEVDFVGKSVIAGNAPDVIPEVDRKSLIWSESL